MKKIHAKARKALLRAALAALPLSIAGTASAASDAVIVYFSRTGHVETVAKTLGELTGAPLVRIEPVTPYPEAYSETTEIVQRQMREGVVPPIRPVSIDWASVKTVYLGSPTWWGHISRPMERFLTDCKFTGKTVRLFTSHGGSGVASTLSDVRRLCPDNTVTESIAFHGTGFGHAGQLRAWIARP